MSAWKLVPLWSMVDLEQWLWFVPPPYRPWVLPAAGLIVALIVLRATWRIAAAYRRRRRPPAIHPRLQKYNVDRTEEARRHRELAKGIVATSTGQRLAGYRIVRQVEAVFVEGYTSPEDALLALKGSAAELGANAVLNVATDRTAAGRCTASGDAVLVAAVLSPPARHRSPESPSPGDSPSLPSDTD